MLSHLRLAKYRFTLTPATALRLNQFVGSTLRGAFGGVFRRLVCVTRAERCEGCLLRNQCAYGYVFETAPPPGSERLRNYQDIPRPFVIEPPIISQGGRGQGTGGRGQEAGDKGVPYLPPAPCPVSHTSTITFAPGEEFSFHLVLIGRAMDYLPYFVFVFRELEKHGLGRGRQEGQGQFQLRQVSALLPDGAETVIYTRDTDRLTEANATLTESHFQSRALQLTQPPNHPTTQPPNHPTAQPPNHPTTQLPNHPTTQLTLHFLTPTRIKFEGRLLDDFQFHHLIRALLRRLSGLIYFHCGGVLEADFQGLIEQARGIEKVGDALRWQEQTRYSARQKTELQMGGFVGTATFAGDFAPFLPLLAAGEWTHVGKGCVMGLGQYQIGKLGN